MTEPFDMRAAVYLLEMAAERFRALRDYLPRAGVPDTYNDELIARLTEGAAAIRAAYDIRPFRVIQHTISVDGDTPSWLEYRGTSSWLEYRDEAIEASS